MLYRSAHTPSGQADRVFAAMAHQHASPTRPQSSKRPQSARVHGSGRRVFATLDDPYSWVPPGDAPAASATGTGLGLSTYNASVHDHFKADTFNTPGDLRFTPKDEAQRLNIPEPFNTKKKIVDAYVMAIVAMFDKFKKEFCVEVSEILGTELGKVCDTILRRMDQDQNVKSGLTATSQDQVDRAIQVQPVKESVASVEIGSQIGKLQFAVDKINVGVQADLAMQPVQKSVAAVKDAVDKIDVKDQVDLAIQPVKESVAAVKDAVDNIDVKDQVDLAIQPVKESVASIMDAVLAMQPVTDSVASIKVLQGGPENISKLMQDKVDLAALVENADQGNLTYNIDILCSQIQGARLRIPARTLEEAHGGKFSIQRGRTMSELVAEGFTDAVTDELVLLPHDVRFTAPVEVFIPLAVPLDGCLQDCGVVVMKKEEDGSIHEIAGTHCTDYSQGSPCQGIQVMLDSFSKIWARLVGDWVGCSLMGEIDGPINAGSAFKLTTRLDANSANVDPLQKRLKHNSTYHLIIRATRDGSKVSDMLNAKEYMRRKFTWNHTSKTCSLELNGGFELDEREARKGSLQVQVFVLDQDEYSKFQQGSLNFIPDPDIPSLMVKIPDNSGASLKGTESSPNKSEKNSECDGDTIPFPGVVPPDIRNPGIGAETIRPITDQTEQNPTPETTSTGSPGIDEDVQTVNNQFQEAAESIKNLPQFFETTSFVPPHKLPCAEKMLQILNKKVPQLIKDAKSNGSLFRRAIEAGTNYVKEYTKMAETHYDEPTLEASTTSEKAKIYEEAYTSHHKVITDREKEAYEDYQRSATGMKSFEKPYLGILDKAPDPVQRLIDSYVAADELKSDFVEPLMKDIKEYAEKNQLGLIDISTPGLKGLGRTIEKDVLRPDEGLGWDTNRFMCEFSDMKGIVAILKYFLTYTNLDIIRVNNRFKLDKDGNPVPGWADCALYVTSSDPKYKQSICEIQLVHKTMLQVRKDWGAHDVYDDCRFGSELLKKWFGTKSNSQPWSLEELTKDLEEKRQEIEQLKQQVHSLEAMNESTAAAVKQDEDNLVT